MYVLDDSDDFIPSRSLNLKRHTNEIDRNSNGSNSPGETCISTNYYQAKNSTHQGI